jgi:hypothetical protein
MGVGGYVREVPRALPVGLHFATSINSPFAAKETINNIISQFLYRTIFLAGENSMVQGPRIGQSFIINTGLSLLTSYVILIETS